MQLLKALNEFAGGGRLYARESMAKHTSFHIGGPAEALFMPETDAELSRAACICLNENIPLTVIGNGSNLLVRDGGIPGLVIALGAPFAGVAIDGTTARARAGTLLPALSRAAQAAGLKGLEFASGIPGSVGGGCVMNAGAYGGQLADVVKRVALMPRAGAGAYSLDNAQMRFGYRVSAPQSTGDIVTEVEFELTPDDPHAIQARMDDLTARRREKQPLSLPSAGSVFKRPEGHFAGALIEGAGLKGAREGGAMVSDKHAGFILNAGGATANDVLKLIERIRRAVFERFGVMLETEIRVLGEGE